MVFNKRNIRHLGTQRQLFLDDDIIDELSGMNRRLGSVEKHPANPLVKAEAPWEKRFPISGLVLHHQDYGYRMWYGVALTEGEGNLPGDPRFATSYCISEDGIHWQRPALGVIEWKGARDNNMILTGTGPNAMVFRPEDPNPASRYRMLAVSPDRKRWEIYPSPDGIHWAAPPSPGPQRDYGILARDAAHLFYDDARQEWVSFCKLCRRVGHWPDWSIRRSWGVSTSVDGEEWEVPELVLAPDARDDAMSAQRLAQVADRLTINHPDEYWCDFQYMIIWPYEGLYIALLSVFDASGLSPAGNQDGTVRVQLAVSRDLRHWQRVADRQTFIDLGPRGAFDDSMIFFLSSAPTVLEDEIRAYYTGMGLSHMHPGYWTPAKMPAVPGGIGLATIRRDGFVAIEVGEIGRNSEAYFRTKHFTFSGSQLYLNVDCGSHGRARGFTRVEIVEPDDTPIPGFTRADCDPITWDSVRQVVTWQGNPDISSLQDRIVRLKFYCRTTRLYSFWFEP